MKYFILLLSSLMALSSCKSVRYTPKTYTKTQIVAGSSGGVTGMIREYSLLDNGQLFISKGFDGEWKEVKKIEKKKTQDIFNKATAIGLETIIFSHPGNMTYYLIMKSPSRKNEVRWGETGVAMPEKVKEFYDYLMTIF